MYIDETGTTNLDDTKQPVLTLVAAVVPEGQVSPLAASLRQVALAGLGWVPPDFEFHGQELWAGTKVWAGVDPPQLLAIYHAALALLEQHEVSIAYASIDKPKLKAKYNDPGSAYLLALQFLLQKVHTNWPGTLKVVVADESKEQELHAIKMVADLQTWGSGVVPGPPLPSIIDTLHFVRSEASPGVQIADLVAFVIHRHALGVDKHPNAVANLQQLRSTVGSATRTWREVWPP